MKVIFKKEEFWPVYVEAIKEREKKSVLALELELTEKEMIKYTKAMKAYHSAQEMIRDKYELVEEKYANK